MTTQTVDTGTASAEAEQITAEAATIHERGIDWGTWLAGLSDSEREQARKAARTALVANLPDGDVPDEGIRRLNFTEEPPPPQYLAGRFFERGTVNIASGDTGSAKSYVMADLSVAAVTEREWLGREVRARRILYVDEENPDRQVIGRLRALGLRDATAEQQERLFYTNREGIRIGDERWDAWLRHTVESHRAELAIIDTALAATTAEVLDNNSVTKLYNSLRPIAKDVGTAFLILHHERKVQADRPNTRSQAMMGARSWAGQSDTHLTMEKLGRTQRDAEDDGGEKLRSEFALDGGKEREGAEAPRELIVIESRKRPDGRLDWVKVRSEGAIARPTTDEEGMVDAIAEAVEDAPKDGMARKDIAEAIPTEDNGTFKAGMRKAVETGRIRKVRHGHYGPAGTGGLAVA